MTSSVPVRLCRALSRATDSGSTYSNRQRGRIASTAPSASVCLMRSGGRARGAVMLGLGVALSSACGSTFKGEPGSAGSAAGGSSNGAGSSFAGKSAAGSANDAGASGSTQGGAPGAAGAALSGGDAGAARGGDESGGGEPTSAGSGGAAGGAGPEVTLAECAADQDCQVVDDCCTCAALPKSEQKPACSSVCIQSACQARGLAGAKAHCVANRCVFDVTCDRAQVTCEAPTPTCPSSQVPSVSGSCWGPCVPAQDCQAVTNCDDCAAGQICVRDELQIRSTHCVEASASCVQHPTCECTNACNFQCSDENGIGCFCSVC